MNYVVQKLEERLANSPDHAFLYDEATPKGLTFERFYDLSGRVYAYLKGKGVGKEDFVLINLPRGVQPLVAVMGVWRTGAAFALVEDTYAPERIDFIRKDCGCKAELNAAVWDEVMACEPASGYADVGDHDAAYAIYTSGTTGNPKGVLHEYGNLREAMVSLTLDGHEVVPQDERFVLAAPLNFVASIIVFLKLLDLAEPKMWILSYATVKNPMKLGLFMLEKRISCTFLTPSYVRALGTKTGPFLKRLFVGSEPANGIDPGKLELFNVYAQSESGFATGFFRIDKSYDTCPIGRPQFEKRIYLLDESGKEVADGETGELCFDNPFVRGYLNLPEETARVFVNGVYHSGDLAKKLPDGNYVLLGRNTDMVKINGNRVEPAEVEAAVKQVLGIDWCAVRGFEDDAQAFLAAYYTADIPKPETAKVREALSRRLPYYMLPQYFVKIDKVPLKPNGKMDRKALPKPDTSDYVSDYVAPRNDTEKAICTAMAAALRLKRIGVTDDFYELGGDSLGAMQVVTGCGLKGLSSAEIYRGRTPEKIAALYLERFARNDGEDFAAKDAKARGQTHRLTAEQNYMVDYQLYTPKSTMYNLFATVKVEKGMFESAALAAAITRTLRAHPSLATVLEFDDDGDIVQRYCPEVIEDVQVTKLSEFDFEQIKDDLVKPYKIVGSRLYRCKLFETEKALYLFFDVHHTVFDGTSFKVLMADIAKAYMGEELEKDYYYLMLAQREEAENSPFYAESREYFEKTYGGSDWTCRPKTDHESRENRAGETACGLEISQAEMKRAEKAFKVSRNEFFLAAFAISFALKEGAKNVKFSWIYNGREDVEAMSTCGLLFRDLPIGFRFADDMDVRDIFASASEQVAKAIEHSCYPYCDKVLNVVSDDVPYVLYQNDIHDAGMAEGMAFEQIAVRQNNAASQTILDVEVLDGHDGLQLAVHYSASRYEQATIEAYRNLYAEVCRLLVAHTDQSALTFGMIRDQLFGKPTLWRRFAALFATR